MSTTAKPLVMKIIRPHLRDVEAVRASIYYIARLNADQLAKGYKPDLMDEVGGLVIPEADTPEADRAVIRQLLEDEWFDEAVLGPADKRAKRKAYHIVVSLNGDWPDADPGALVAGVSDFIQKHLAMDGFRAVWALHDDTQDPHVHMVVCARNSLTGRQIRFAKDNKELQAFRDGLASSLRQAGIEVDARTRRDRDGMVYGSTGPLRRLALELSKDAPGWMLQFGAGGVDRLSKRILDRIRQDVSVDATPIPVEAGIIGQNIWSFFEDPHLARSSFEEFVEHGSRRRALRMLRHFPELFGAFADSDTLSSWPDRYFPILSNAAELAAVSGTSALHRDRAAAKKLYEASPAASSVNSILDAHERRIGRSRSSGLDIV